MGSHESGCRPAAGRAAGRPGLLDPCPVPGAEAQPLSWELGERITEGEAGDRVLELEDTAGGATATVYEATANTAVVVVRTPVGRRHYYEVPADAVDRALGRAVRYGDWHVTYRRQ